ncbi:Holliday junction branch migration protein RuvA [Segetibacter sp. 3557_3]|uniref:Holliday junction branch migration protein RuvA n=1 Tax=Segetibacter sp. 3557_3 TaxID=2547429 RepID=UPI001058A68B|nr:Holliday junction branch migration protein RuvA [Segetibacter sp. 3557_3]TDH21238.1 Holliday junction branch migration protein RuvA [Segetibacter sp. 3557_3]
MISFLRGNFLVRNPAQVVVDVNGVGYECQISLNTYSAINGKTTGLLFTYLQITENAQTLYGFAEQAEKDLFIHLISVSGVGAATARMMLSGMKPDETVRAIVQGNARQLESIKGIGRKTAERLVLELRDKLGKISLESTVLPSASNKMETDALNALVSLGIVRPQAEQAIKKALLANPDTTILEDLIKQALKNV